MSLSEKIQQSNAQNAKLASLIEKFPDLKEHKNRWNRIRYVSPSVNTIANEIEIRHSCGCCNDAALIVSAYIKFDEFEIYADPVEIFVGTKYGHKDIPNIHWQDDMKKYKLTDSVISKVQDYFGSYSEDEDVL